MKAGIDFFPIDVHLDDKWKLIEAEYGLKGFAVVVKLLQKIYGECGYYCEWNEDVALLFGKSIGLPGGNAVSEIINATLSRGIFDREKYENYAILTSSGIQRRYFEAVKRRKEITVVQEYTLFDVTLFLKDVNIIWKNVNKNGKNVYISQQSKVEKSKVKNSREISAPATIKKEFVKPSLDEIKKYCSERQSKINPQQFFDFYESKGWRVGNSPMEDWKACVRTWETRERRDVSQKRALVGGKDLPRREYTEYQLNGLFTKLEEEDDLPK